jgi:hypothetical protein
MSGLNRTRFNGPAESVVTPSGPGIQPGANNFAWHGLDKTERERLMLTGMRRPAFFQPTACLNADTMIASVSRDNSPHASINCRKSAGRNNQHAGGDRRHGMVLPFVRSS